MYNLLRNVFTLVSSETFESGWKMQNRIRYNLTRNVHKIEGKALIPKNKEYF